MTSSSYDPMIHEFTPEEIDELVLLEYPYPIAANYRRVLEAKDWERRTRECIKVFEYGMRTITLWVLSQYLIQDRDEFSDPDLNRELFKQKLTNISTGKWVDYLFMALKAYYGKREFFFIQELYDLYWDTSHIPHQQHKGVRVPFNQLIQIRNTIEHKAPPKDEKGWEKIGREALENLRDVMGHFSFLQNYDLIRVVKSVGAEYEYERFTGQVITHHQENLKSREKIQPGWFYLLRQDHSLLGLHPLLIFWTSSQGEDWIEGKEPEEQDVAVFEELLKDTAGYIATVVREVIQTHDAALVSQVRDLINYNLEQVKMARQQVKLSWDAVREATYQVSSEEMESAQKKYVQSLYLQRDTVYYKKFQDFLSSDSTCFVLTGKSGVGKSNFVLSLAEALASKEQITVLMYNAARLDVSSIGLVQKISQDLGKLIKLGDKTGQDVFAELDRSKVMTGKQLLVIFDAINENTNPREVLQKIDQLVGGERYPWLKILITSRPEGWRTMKRGLPLAEDRYYREKGSEKVSVELEEFTVKLDIFERDELRAAYEKYRRFFNLQTEYSTLEPAVRSALRDPLILRLVADIYRDKFIPGHIQVNDIYRAYVNNLLNSGRLYHQDVDFLEQELMPLMINDGSYSNIISGQQLQNLRTSEGRPLLELIFSDDEFSNGKRVNQSFTNLVDANILILIGSSFEYEIAFKYSRFYEFFARRRINNLIRIHQNATSFYIELIERTTNASHLRNSIKSIFVDAAAEGNLPLILELCFTPHQPIARMMIDVLTDLGNHRLDVAEKILLQLITPESKPTLLEKVKKILKKSTTVSDIRTRNAKKIAIQVARNLGAPWVLFYGLSAKESTLSRLPKT